MHASGIRRGQPMPKHGLTENLKLTTHRFRSGKNVTIGPSHALRRSIICAWRTKRPARELWRRCPSELRLHSCDGTRAVLRVSKDPYASRREAVKGSTTNSQKNR